MKNRSKFMRLFTNLGALPDKTAEITRCMRGRTHAEKEAIAARPIKELEEGKIPQHEISPTVNIIDRKKNYPPECFSGGLVYSMLAGTRRAPFFILRFATDLQQDIGINTANTYKQR